MHQQNELQYRQKLFTELTDIVTAMGNLAQVELHRIASVLPGQRQSLAACCRAFQQLQYFYPHAPGIKPQPAMLILLGSERGFCAGFNHQLASHYKECQARFPVTWVVGSQLGKLLAAKRVFAGAGTTDDLVNVVQTLMDALSALPVSTPVWLHCHDMGGPRLMRLRPFAVSTEPPDIHSLHIQEPSRKINQALQWQYLQHALFLYALVSLQAENRQRSQQMEQAKHHLKDFNGELKLQLNRLRQQKIIEDIEVLLAKQEEDNVSQPLSLDNE